MSWDFVARLRWVEEVYGAKLLISVGLCIFCGMDGVRYLIKGASAMKVLISAGGTSERIDNIRSITNHSTGRLGSIIADKFALCGSQVIYLCGERALLPQSKNIEVVRISGVQSLIDSMEQLFASHKFDCIIHSMAVSDFTPKGSVSVDEIAENVLHALENDISLDAIKSAILLSCRPLSGNKISSRSSNLMIMLENTPKVIGLIRKMQPETVLVGFKLLSDVPENELVQVARDLLIQNACDLVLANDLRDIDGDNHKAILMDRHDILCKADTKQEIADAIYSTVLSTCEKKER